ncbi:MAG: phosphoenolpyruvate--protein phosphotransferase [Actinobacteria bacterium]|nr:phosphoenolpyruvate--protein phosphotransferase [Actinomycetota bacterium]
MPEELAGVPGAPGAVAGPVRHMTDAVNDLGPAEPPEDPEVELQAARDALTEVEMLLEKRSAEATNKDVAEILSAQAMMATDPALWDKIAAAVSGGLPATHAVTQAFESFKTLLEAAGGYMAERAADLDDIRTRVVASLVGSPMPGLPESSEPFILVAKDLAPADTSRLDPSMVLGLVTREGGPTSHTAIIARSLAIPAVVSCSGAAGISEGEPVVVDGDRGVVVRSPDPGLLEDVARRAEWMANALRSSTGPGRTSDGHAVGLLANVGGIKDAEVSAADSEGVGLFRTEFLFLDRAEEPSVDEQEQAYRAVFDAFGERKVVVRTLDAGADKPLRWLDLGEEMNPALGVRGVRTQRVRADVLERQLEAVQRAAKASETDVWVMAPMITTVGEAAEFVAMAHDQGLSRAGVMVEVPALAVCADDAAEVVDFFSIGTNDLSQYVTAADRTIGALSDLLDHWQPALVRLIRTITDAARSASIPASVCGESAGDPLFALVLAGLGITSLSMAPASLPLVRASLARHTIDDCRRLAELALTSDDHQLARSSVAEAAHLPIR